MLAHVNDVLVVIKYSYQLGTFRALNRVTETMVLFHSDIWDI